MYTRCIRGLHAVGVLVGSRPPLRTPNLLDQSSHKNNLKATVKAGEIGCASSTHSFFCYLVGNTCWPPVAKSKMKTIKQIEAGEKMPRCGKLWQNHKIETTCLNRAVAFESIFSFFLSSSPFHLSSHRTQCIAAQTMAAFKIINLN